MPSPERQSKFRHRKVFRRTYFALSNIYPSPATAQEGDIVCCLVPLAVILSGENITV